MKTFQVLQVNGHYMFWFQELTSANCSETIGGALLDFLTSRWCEYKIVSCASLVPRNCQQGSTITYNVFISLSSRYDKKIGIFYIFPNRMRINTEFSKATWLKMVQLVELNIDEFWFFIWIITLAKYIQILIFNFDHIITYHWKVCKKINDIMRNLNSVE